MEREEFYSHFNAAETEINPARLNITAQKSLRQLPDSLNEDGTLNLIIALEELGKLSCEVSRFVRGEGDMTNLLMTLADVMLGVKWVQETVGIPDEDLNKALNVRLTEQEALLKEGKF